MKVWKYVSLATLLAVAVGVAISIQYFTSPPISGEVWLMVSEGELMPTVQAYTLPTLMQVDFPHGAEIEIATVVQKTLMFDASQALDGTVAYLSKSKGKWQVFVDEKPLTDTPTIKRDLSLAPDGLSLAYSEISASSTAAERQNPDSWSVVRLLRNGDSIIVGYGIKPVVLVGPETAALTTRGVVSLRLGEEPILLLASTVPIRSTPLAVSPDGLRIAWINPGDQSLQVFERTPANTYTPMLIKPNFQATSLLFSPDGTALLASRSVGEETIFIHVVLPTGTERMTNTLPLFATLSAWIQK